MRATARIEPLKDFARRSLLARRAALIGQRETADAAANELLAAAEPDWEDRAANVTAASALTRLADGERAQLRLVHSALLRIDEGTWGTCTSCGHRIHEARLRVAPEASRCARCSSLL